MSRTLLFAVLVGCMLLAPPARAAATNLVANGGFETTDGWTFTGAAARTPVAHAGAWGLSVTIGGPVVSDARTPRIPVPPGETLTISAWALATEPIPGNQMILKIICYSPTHNPSIATVSYPGDAVTPGAWVHMVLTWQPGSLRQGYNACQISFPVPDSILAAAPMEAPREVVFDDVGIAVGTVAAT